MRLWRRKGVSSEDVYETALPPVADIATASPSLAQRLVRYEAMLGVSPTGDLQHRLAVVESMAHAYERLAVVEALTSPRSGGAIGKLPPNKADTLSQRAEAAARKGLDPEAAMSDAQQRYAAQNRRDQCADLLDLYKACTWVSRCIDTTAATITAGGVKVQPREVQADGDPTKAPTLPSSAGPLLELLDWVNPKDDIAQLMRKWGTDAEIFGDGFLEVVWLLGLPVALYQQDASTTTSRTDANGNVLGYIQTLDRNRTVEFAPHEIIHVQADNPSTSLYGLGSIEKNVQAIVTWVFTQALLKETMRKGNPPRVAFEAGPAVSQNELDEFVDRYYVEQVGIPNIGNALAYRGYVLKELQVSKIAELLASRDKERDTIVSGMGLFPAQVGIIESGNLGGGTGTSQWKSFKALTCAPKAKAMMEKFNFSMTWQAFGLRELITEFGEIDWRDDKTVDDIDSQRLRDGRITLNQALRELGRPGIGPDGDIHILVDRQNLVVWSDIPAISAQVAAGTLQPQTTPQDPDDLDEPPGPKPPVKESLDPAAVEGGLTEAYRRRFAARRRQVLKEMPQP
jgi:hypothetical protein